MKLLEKLSNAFGVPGYEDDVRAIVKEELAPHAHLSFDKLGSLIAEKKCDAALKRVLLVAHMDEVAFVVQNITSDGFIKFHPQGGWWDHTLLGQRLLVRGKKGYVEGVIGAKPVHHLAASEKNSLISVKDMLLDLGFSSKEEVLEAGIDLGSPIVPSSKFSMMSNSKKVMGKAFDDRVGVALMIETFKHFSSQNLPIALVGGASAQEEVGTRGARTICEIAKPDIAIILEGTPADDTPGFKKEESQAVLGNGPQIRIQDPTILCNPSLVEFVRGVARERKIAHQFAVRTSGGTDGKEIHLYKVGVPTIIISVPVRYIHSHSGVLAVEDYYSTLELLKVLVEKLTPEVIDSFTTF